MTVAASGTTPWSRSRSLATGSITRAALSLNTAVHERGRGGGVFVELGERTVGKAAELGVESVVGVANANSTPGFVRRLGFDLLAPLPAKMITPLPGSSAGIHSADVRAGAQDWGLGSDADAILAVPRSR